jgi:hypothetical protein
VFQTSFFIRYDLPNATAGIAKKVDMFFSVSECQDILIKTASGAQRQTRFGCFILTVQCIAMIFLGGMIDHQKDKLLIAN